MLQEAQAACQISLEVLITTSLPMDGHCLVAKRTAPFHRVRSVTACLHYSSAVAVALATAPPPLFGVRGVRWASEQQRRLAVAQEALGHHAECRPSPPGLPMR